MRVGQDAQVPLLRSAVLLGICAVVTGGLAVLAVADPFHLRHARWFTSGLILLTLLLLTAAATALARRGAVRVPVLLLGAAASLGWITLVGLAAQLDVESTVVSAVTDGDRRLVVVEGGAFATDPVYAVVLRSGGGPFEQETVVYQGWEEGPAPVGVRFVDGNTVEVRTGGGCRYRSEVEPVTLDVDPVHRPLRLNAC